VVGNGKRFLKEKLNLGSFKDAIIYDSEYGAEKAMYKMINNHADTRAHLAEVLKRGYVVEYIYNDSEYGQNHIANMKKYIRGQNPKGLKVMKVTVTLG